LPDLAPQPIDLIHAHNLHGGFFDLRCLGALSRRLPFVLTLHDEWLFTGHCAYTATCQRWLTGCGACPDLGIYPAISRDGTARNWRIKAATYRQSQLFVATPSRWLMAEAQRSMLAAGIAAARVIPNGVDLDLFRPHDRRAARRRLGLAEDRPLLLAVANRIRSNRFKDWGTLQRAMTEIARLRPDHEILFIGLGDEAPDEKIGPVTIRFVPFEPVPETIALYYQAADLYLHAAKSENFPTTVLEALACGTPVVATAVGGIPEQIDDLSNASASGVANGVLSPPGDGAAMAAAVISLLADPALLKSMGEHARAAATARFGVERMVAAYLDWYREIAGERVRAPIRSGS
ncbi:MAG: glycosyltransferase, partial [Rhodospirillales bacterium]|nr:glycosyltransferase [Rhodospirillales bacterium]